MPAPALYKMCRKNNPQWALSHKSNTCIQKENSTVHLKVSPTFTHYSYILLVGGKEYTLLLHVHQEHIWNGICTGVRYYPLNLCAVVNKTWIKAVIWPLVTSRLDCSNVLYISTFKDGLETSSGSEYGKQIINWGWPSETYFSRSEITSLASGLFPSAVQGIT